MTVAHFYTVKQNRQKYTKYKTPDIKHKAWNLQYAACDQPAARQADYSSFTREYKSQNHFL